MKGFNGATTEFIQLDPTAGGYCPRDGNAAEMRAACNAFLRQREPGYQDLTDAASGRRQRGMRKAPVITREGQA